MLSQLPSMYSAQGIFQHPFQYKKVHTILNEIGYLMVLGARRFEPTYYTCAMDGFKNFLSEKTILIRGARTLSITTFSMTTLSTTTLSITTSKTQHSAL